MIHRPGLAARAFNTPLCVDARKAATLAHLFGVRVTGEDPIVLGAEAIDHVAFAQGRPSASRLGNDPTQRMRAEGRKPYAMVGPVAVIAIEGTLVHKGAWVGSYSGDTSYQGLAAQANAALVDREVRGVVFEVDSFGGQVSGMEDAARALARLSQAKPTVAILTDFALSAGYALASTARQIVMPKHGEAGSIGAVMLHVDMRGVAEKMGAKVTVLRSGARKAEGNAYEDMTDFAREAVQASLDAVRDDFAGMVARNRAGRITKDAALATEAASFSGPEALSLGLVDALGHPSEAFEAFVARLSI